MLLEPVCKARSFMPRGLALGLPLLAHGLEKQGPSVVGSGPWGYTGFWSRL